ncbi:M23 family metallopeptidase [bacterium]|nr:M23 family metallopeptidase [candidate division CSSED10-310 bacterium]
MRIDFTWPDHLIPMVAAVGDGQHIVDLFINSILLENDEDTSRRLTRVILDLMDSDNPLWRMEIPLPALISHLAVDSKIHTLPEDVRTSMVGDYLTSRIMRVQSDATFAPGSQGLLRRFPIRFIASTVPNTLIARAFSGPHLIGRSEVALVPFKNRFLFHFPVSGIWQVIRNFDYTLGHRGYAGQEFAVDLVQLGTDGMIRKQRTDTAEDYFCFGAAVEAIADGEVIRCESRLTDNPVHCESDPSQMAERIKTYGYLSAHSGNFVIIKHTEDRFSFYAHLKHESVTVTPGSPVEKGQVIGTVGNSGQCSIAHLHLQLNEGPNPLGSRGLPMTFDDLRDLTGNPLPLITNNNVVVHRKI